MKRNFELKVGLLYKLPHGTGKLIGKERFNSEGGTMSPDTENLDSSYEYQRYLFEIDGSCKWSKLMGTTKYACLKKNIQEL